MAKKSNNTKLRVMMLGGLNEIGKNLAVLEYGNDMLIVDCGLAFPDDDMLGVDLVIPDISYLEKNVDKIRGILLTHGHEDHIGALPYVLRTINPPIYGTRLTLGILENKLAEQKLPHKVTMTTVSAGDTVTMGTPIGKVANTALLESAIGDHLHFSVTHNDEPMDPMAFFELS